MSSSKRRNLALPPPNQQQQQGQPTRPVLLQQQHSVQYNHQQQLQLGGQLGLPPFQQQPTQQQLPGVRLPTPTLGLQQQGATAAEGDRPSKQPKLEQPVAMSTAAAAMQVNPAAAAALASAAEEARKGSEHLYRDMTPEQAVVVWGLWPRVVELQQRVLMRQQRVLMRQQQGSTAAETQAQPQQQQQL